MITWFLQDIIFSSEDQLLDAKKIIELFGDKYEQIYDMKTYLNNKNLDYPTIINGHKYTGFASIQNTNTIKECLLSCEEDFLFYNKDNYSVSTYYKFIKEYLLNKDCLFVPKWTLRDFEFFSKYVKYFNTDKLFIKPNSGNKSFTGFVFNGFDDLQKELKYISGKNDTVVLAPEKDIICEYRFYIVNNKISTSSIYKSNRERVPRTPLDSIFNFVNSMLIPKIGYPCFTVDMCYHEKKGTIRPSVVELNALSTSGIYEDVNLKKLLTDVRNYIKG